MARTDQTPRRGPRAATPFARRVYDALRRVPRGRVTTYRLLADALGCRSAQAVGQALKRNPDAPRIPCHRVIASDLSPGGFQGRRAGPALRLKLARLAAEGVRFAAGRLAEPWRVVAAPARDGRRLSGRQPAGARVGAR